MNARMTIALSSASVCTTLMRTIPHSRRASSQVRRPVIRVATGCRSLVSNTGLPAQDLRRLAVSANERAPHVITAREAALAGDVVDRIVPLLQHDSGGFGAQTLDGFGGRAAGRWLECA